VPSATSQVPRGSQSTQPQERPGRSDQVAALAQCRGDGREVLLGTSPLVASHRAAQGAGPPGPRWRRAGGGSPFLLSRNGSGPRLCASVSLPLSVISGADTVTWFQRYQQAGSNPARSRHCNNPIAQLSAGPPGFESDPGIARLRATGAHHPWEVLMSRAALTPTVPPIRPWLRRSCWPAGSQLDGWLDT